ncbi:MAG: DUF1015 domain-containing protein [Dehalococcoidales bacterium]
MACAKLLWITSPELQLDRKLSVADIRPFRGVRYNQRLVNDLAAVICPPYDIITPQMQPELYRRSEYNFVRLEFNRELPQDTANDNKYTRSAATLEQWLKQDILVADEKPAIYLHDHYFTHQDREYRRRGMIARVRLEEWDRTVVRPHEGTMAEPKGDRLSLLWALQANTSSVFTFFEDRGKQISSLLTAEGQKPPIISIGAGGERHDLWAITDTEAVNQIHDNFADRPLYIADGHHRYESALAYRRERCAISATVSGDEGFNFVMMTLVDLADPGLIILPPHRLVRGVSKSTLDGLLARLKRFFEIEELSSVAAGTWQRIDELLSERTDQVMLVLFGLTGERPLLLRLRDFDAADRMMPHFHSELYKQLDVSVADHVILEGLLGFSHGREEASLAYSYDRQDALNRVQGQEFQLAFLLRPLKAAAIKAVADAGDRMPRKSTYFYPKLPSGLIFHTFSQP